MSNRPQDQAPPPEASPQSARGVTRRGFLRAGAVAGVSGAAAVSCQMPVESIVPFNERPEGLRAPGKTQTYATVIDGVPVHVRTREGRPILVTPPVDHPARLGLTVRHHAALLDLYDPDRAPGPLSVRRGKGPPAASSWEAVGAAAVRALKKSKGRWALLTGPLNGSATTTAVDAFVSDLGGEWVTWAPIRNGARTRAWKTSFGDMPIPRPRLDRAALVVSFGAEFLDHPQCGLEAGWAAKRDPEGRSGLSRLIAFEGRLTLTGANADQRVRVRDSQLAGVAAAVAHALLVTHKIGPMAGDEAVIQGLGRFAPEAVAERAGISAETIHSVAKAIADAGPYACVLAGGSASAGPNGEALEIAVNLINASVGAFRRTFDLRVTAARAPQPPSLQILSALIARMKTGTISTLIVAGCNPIYDAPRSLGLADALSQVELVVSLNDRIDETSAQADYLAPVSHALESWGDAALPGNRHAVQQPVVQPLYDTHGLLDVLAVWGEAAGADGAFAAAAQAARAQPEADELTPNPSPGHHLVRTHWARQLMALGPEAPRFDDAWLKALQTGFWQGLASIAVPPRFLSGAVTRLKGAAEPPSSKLELTLYPHFALHDGRSANNGWLLELGDPLSRICWGNWVAIAPRRFDDMNLTNGDRVALEVNGQQLTLPAYRQAGMHADEIAVPLGWGRSAVGKVGNGVGHNAFDLMTLDGDRGWRSGLPVTLRATGDHEPLAIAQGAEVLDRKPRPLVPVTTLDAYRKDPRAGTEQIPGGPSAWPEHAYDGHRWEMAIDLSRCTGCGKCSLACQAENNIPVVGRQGIIDGRGMAWMRIDRYYDAPPKPGGWDDAVWDGPLPVVEDPVTLFQPMLCQHCDNAPCETVCPFVATMHSADGLNQQIYNRCAGTRYCANNCPFKVRRFNWFEYSIPHNNALFALLVPSLDRHAEINTRGRLRMKNNPEVTVRGRGVMEKCSFCVQRIREARAEATRQGRPGQIHDGEVVPACMESCPTGAIVFGDVNDPKSRLHGLAKSPRAMRLLEATAVKPSISYLTKVRNV